MENRQNEHMLHNLARVTVAINVLDNRGITVTSADISGPHPLITVLPGAACSNLKEAWSKNINRDGRRQIERCAIVSNCQVVWQDYA